MHAEFKHIVHGSDRAILFVHGILGTPRHFDELVAMVPKDVSVWNLLLDGHGKGVRDFSGASMAKWETQVHRAVAELACAHETIYIAAHSMGCLLAVGEAVKEPRIKGLFFLAAPLKLSLKLPMVTNSMKVYLNRVRPDDGPGLAAKRCCGITQSPNPLLYLGWVPRFLELFHKIHETRKQLPLLTVPCWACQSAKDEMVSCRSTEILRTNPHITATDLPHSGHFYYAPTDLEVLKKTFGNLL